MKRAIGIVLAILILGFLALLLLAGAPFLLQAALRLLFGWITFLPNRLPQATVDWSGVGTMALCLGLSAAFAHSFCSWVWKGGGRSELWRPRWTAAGLAAVMLMFVSGMAVTGVAHQIGWLIHSPEPLVRGQGNERNASATLKTILSAQEYFRSNVRSEDRPFQFWRADIAGLYTTVQDGQPIKLIELSFAAADDRPKSDLSRFAVRSPKAGYYFRALLHADEKEPDPNRFAACAFPASRSAGKWMFIVCEDRTVLRREFGGEPPAVYPSDPRAEGWAPLD